MTEDLETYQFQLDQVNEATEKDPKNSELLKLGDDLLQLGNLLKQANTETSSNSNSKQSNENINKRHSKVNTPTETSDDVIMAKWSVDKQFYEATVLEVISPTSYKIVFNGYDNEEIVNDNDIK